MTAPRPALRPILLGAVCAWLLAPAAASAPTFVYAEPPDLSGDETAPTELLSIFGLVEGAVDVNPFDNADAFTRTGLTPGAVVAFEATAERRGTSGDYRFRVLDSGLDVLYLSELAVTEADPVFRSGVRSVVVPADGVVVFGVRAEAGSGGNGLAWAYDFTVPEPAAGGLLAAALLGALRPRRRGGAG